MIYQRVGCVLFVVGVMATFSTPIIAIISGSLPLTLVAFVGGSLTFVVGLLLQDNGQTTTEKLFFFLFVVCGITTTFSLVGFVGAAFNLWDRELVPPFLLLPATAVVLAFVTLVSAKVGWIALRRS